jgi:Zn-dependent protease with chaperone function
MPLTCPRCSFNIPIGRSFCPSCSLFIFSGQAISRPGSPRPADIIIGSARVSVDCAAAAVVDAIPILPQVIEAFIQHWKKPQMRAKLLGNGVRVSRDQFSEIHALVELQANALDLPLPEVFIEQSPELNAHTFGTNEDAYIVVSSALVDLFDHDELGFILGHEMVTLRLAMSSMDLHSSV